MNIKRISCSQFAGVHNRDIVLEPGINTLCGRNESGKSTMANLLAALFFRSTKLHRTKDKDFYENYFPNAVRGGATAGDFVDGKVTIETDKGTFVLSKDWGTDARSTLSTPAGIIRDPDLINETLATILQYGEGVYTGMLFSSQRSTDATLRTILEASQANEVKKSLANAITMAFSETDGVSVEEIEQAILEKIDDLEGKHWDRDTKRPKRRAERWITGLGEVHKAYYAMEDAQNTLKELIQLEQQADDATKLYDSRSDLAQKAEAAWKEFQKIYGKLESKAAQERLVQKLKDDLARMEALVANWPALEEKVSKLRDLAAELETQVKADKYESASTLENDLEDLFASMGTQTPTDADIKTAQAYERQIIRLESQLGGMSIAADIKTYGHPATIRSIASNELLEVGAPIKEAVIISIPGVMELRLTPADIDAAAVESDLKIAREALNDLLVRYQAESTEALYNLHKVAGETQIKIEKTKALLSIMLKDVAMDDLAAAKRAREGINHPVSVIEQEIKTLCGDSDPYQAIAGTEAILKGYQEEHGTLDQLASKVSGLKVELKAAEQALADLGNIPAEYTAVQNPAIHLAMLESDAKKAQAAKEEAGLAKATVQANLESFVVKLADNPKEAVTIAEANFQEQLSLLEKWCNIYTVFQAQKKALSDHPMQEVADKFAANLKAITGGSVESEFEDPDNMAMIVYSQDRVVGFNTLSEGTKETVSLAFRLAVLDHLFPNGGGVIIFDDPMTDMDTERVKASCELLKKAAERHQIIFLTCREEYLPMLGGHNIAIK